MPPAQIRTGLTNAYGSYIKSKVKVLIEADVELTVIDHFYLAVAQ
jgi:hypothetical protein